MSVAKKKKDIVSQGKWIVLAGVLALWLGPVQACAQVNLYTFSSDAVPPALLQTVMQVPQEGAAEINLTFAGDCTLGGEEGGAHFADIVKREGMGYPFEGLQTLFAEDDLTVVNLEGVLSDNRQGKEPGKSFHFIGSTVYANILVEGKVECANLANNHVLDYGMRGLLETRAALKDAGIAYYDEEMVTVLEKDGARIGFTGSLFVMTESRQRSYIKQYQALESVGCQWVVHTLHAGEEYARKPTEKQRSAAAFVVENGASLVVGHHPHVVQGMEWVGDVPILYSLGNCSFGGNTRPRDYDALVLSVQLNFWDGVPQSMQLILHPIRISGEEKVNNYQPILLSGPEALRVMKKMQDSSALKLAPYQEGIGAIQPMVYYFKE